MPRGPTNRMAWLTRPVRTAFRRVSTTASCPTISPNVSGAPASVEGLVRHGRSHDVLRSGRTARDASGELPCTLRRSGRSRAHRNERLGPGRSAAPDDDRLVLLPSGPDTVRGSPLRGTRSSTSRRRAAFENGDLGRGFSPAIADCRYRAPLVPRLARLGKDTPDGPSPPQPSARRQARRSCPKWTRSGSRARSRSVERSYPSRSGALVRPSSSSGVPTHSSTV